MANTHCDICFSAQCAAINEARAEGKSYRVIASETGFGFHTVRNHFQADHPRRPVQSRKKLTAADLGASGKGPEVVVEGNGGELFTGELTKPLDLSTDWDEVLRSFGLDPAVFYVVDDTVKMSKWQTSKRTDDGDRDVIWLYSYKARFARRDPEIEPLDIEALRDKIDRWKPGKYSRGVVSSETAPSTFVVCWADWQIGKSAGGGVQATVDRIHESIDLTLARIKELRKAGRNIEKIAIFNLGDPTEGCDGNYASQLFSVELNQREQLNLVLDLWTTGLAAIEPDIFLSVLCNHGEWKRNGGSKSVTTDSDNVGGYLGDTLRRVFENREDGPSEWHIAHDEFVQTLNLSGIEVAVTHGHKITGKEFEWMRGQGQRIQFETGKMPQLWVTAHRHHVSVEDFGAFWRLQCPSQDGGSKWYSDTTGKWSTPGTLTFLVGEHDTRGWSDLAVLGSYEGHA